MTQTTMTNNNNNMIWNDNIEPPPTCTVVPPPQQQQQKQQQQQHHQQQQERGRTTTPTKKKMTEELTTTNRDSLSPPNHNNTIAATTTTSSKKKKKKKTKSKSPVRQQHNDRSPNDHSSSKKKKQKGGDNNRTAVSLSPVAPTSTTARKKKTTQHSRTTTSRSLSPIPTTSSTRNKKKVSLSPTPKTTTSSTMNELSKNGIQHASSSSQNNNKNSDDDVIETLLPLAPRLDDHDHDAYDDVEHQRFLVGNGAANNDVADDDPTLPLVVVESIIRTKLRSDIRVEVQNELRRQQQNLQQEDQQKDSYEEMDRLLPLSSSCYNNKPSIDPPQLQESTFLKQQQQEGSASSLEATSNGGGKHNNNTSQTSPLPQSSLSSSPEKLPDDSYGFIICSTTCSGGWTFGMFICILQIALFGLFLNNISNFGNSGNSGSEDIFDVPAGVTIEVRITQFFAILISVFVQDDLRTAVELGVQRCMKGFMVVQKINNNKSKQQQQSQEPLRRGSSLRGSLIFNTTSILLDSSSSNRNIEQTTTTRRRTTTRTHRSLVPQHLLLYEPHDKTNEITYLKWYMSTFLRGSQGLLSLFVSFVLIIQSYEVFDLMLNFTAVLFLSEIDELAFILVKREYFGKRMKKNASRVENTFYYYGTEDDGTTARKSKLCFKGHYHTIIMGLIGCAMYAGFGIVWYNQESSLLYYTCQNNGIYVEFGDTVVPVLGIFSGIYYLIDTNYGMNNRLVYVNEYIDDAKFGYCGNEQRWTFFYNTNDDPCDYIVKSSQTMSFDIMAIESGTWFSQNDIPLQYVKFVCYDNNNDNASSSFEKCASIQNINKNNDTLNDGKSISTWCPTLTVPSDQLSGFAADIARDFAALGDGVEVQKHPVYWGPTDNDNSVTDDNNNGSTFDGGNSVTVSNNNNVTNSNNDKLDLILFTGRRWVLTDTSHFMEPIKSAKTGADLEAAFTMLTTTNGDGIAFEPTQFPKDAISFLSDPVNAESDICSPLGLSWHHAIYSRQNSFSSSSGSSPALEVPSPDMSRFVPTSLSCSTCNTESNPCSFEGICQSNGVCSCLHDATGPLCEVPPLQNGVCNTYFNTRAFQFDGGDCCGATCGDSPRCGLGELDFAFGEELTLSGDGFPNCVDDSMIQVKIIVDSSSLGGSWEATLQLVCEGITYLSIPLGKEFAFGTNETVLVKDGTDCTITMSPSYFGTSSAPRVRILQDFQGSEVASLESSSVIDSDQGGNQVYTTIEEEFPVVASWLLEGLFGTSGNTVVIPEQGSAEYSALQWMNLSPSSVKVPDLAKQTFALAVFNYANDNILQSTNGWLSDETKCKWEGVVCDENFRIVQILLEGKNLAGTLPTEIGYLSDLSFFSTTSNQLQGTIPTEIGMMTSLERLYLVDNKLGGTIPSEIGLLKNLSELRLNANILTGLIPSEIGSLENLSILHLQSNQLDTSTSSIPDAVQKLCETIGDGCIYESGFDAILPPPTPTVPPAVDLPAVEPNQGDAGGDDGTSSASAPTPLLLVAFLIPLALLLSF